MTAASHPAFRTGTVVVRGSRIAMASEGAVALLGRAHAELSAVDFLDLVAPEDRAATADRYQRRLRGEPVPNDYEITVLRPDGERATVEVHVDVEGPDVVIQFRDISAELARRRRLLELAALGASVLHEQTEADVFRRVALALPELDLQCALMRPRPDGVTIEWAALSPELERICVAAAGQPLPGYLGRWSPFSYQVWEDGAAFSDDWGLATALFVPDPDTTHARALASAFHLHRAVGLRLDERTGHRFFLVLASTWLRREDLAAARLFASQVSAALDAAHAISDLAQRLSDLTAMHGVTERIFGNPPGDAAALLRDGSRAVATALRCRRAAAFLVEEGGTVLRGVGLARGRPGPEPVRLSVEQGGIGAEAIRTGKPAWGPELRAGRPDRPFLRPGAAALLALPLVSRRQVRGLLLLASVAGRTFGAAERSLALALSGELAVGLENAELYAEERAAAADNARLYQETRRRAEELALLHEVGRSLVASLDIEEVLQAGVRNLARIVDAPLALLALDTPDGGGLEYRAVWGGPRELLGHRPLLDPLAMPGNTLTPRDPFVVEDVLTDPRIPDAARAQLMGRALLALPLLVHDRHVGIAVIIDRQPRRFSTAEVERATAVANQLTVAVENARLYEDLRGSYEQVARTQRQLIERERLAALGELSAVVAHEVRNPLGVIFNSLGSLRRLLKPEGDARVLLDIVGEEADRLNRIVGDLLDFTRPVTLVLRPGPLERVVEEAVSAARAGCEAQVELDAQVAPELPPVPMDARLVRQAVLNVAANAVQAMPRGGRLDVRVRREGSAVLVEVADEGPGIPPEIRARIFEPFFTTKTSGTGLGLAIVKRIVAGHGGEISVSPRPGGGTVVQLRFPVAAGAPAPVESSGGMG